MQRPSGLHLLARRLLFIALVCISGIQPLPAQRQTIDLSGTGWFLWRDETADWQNEDLFPPGADLSKIPSHPPTGGWEQLEKEGGTMVTVPGTVEQYLYRRSAAKNEDKHTEGLVGVSWWHRTVKFPADLAGKTVELCFESARYRAEVYLNEKLVAYNLVEGTPFTANLTGLVKPGETARLAVRITSPGGWWSWEDYQVQNWGKYKVPLSRGFSGVTGAVKLLVLPPAHIDDIYVQNTPAPREVNVEVTLQNDGPAPIQGDVHLEVKEKSAAAPVLTTADLQGLTIPPGESIQTVKIAAPSARLWDLDHPVLYTCTASLEQSGRAVDAQDQAFGFRWFAPENIGQNAVFRLNGKRIVLRTAISWGLWGTTGLVPSPEMAERQIADAKAYGLNMLNFHRAIGQPLVLDQADAMGLLYFEEPGDYVTGSADPFCESLAREKLLRMVKRDRSHPSLVIYNMINEQWTRYHADTTPSLYAHFEGDMAAAHKLDPSRVIVLASSWSRKPAGEDEPVKLNMRPFDDHPYQSGWFDFHRAGGPESWRQEFYTSPAKHYGYTENAGEIVYWGEEGAISSPPRLALIGKEIQGLPNPGWDGEIYLDWEKQFDDFLTRKGLRVAFPSVDDFCVALGAVALEHQGRKIEDTRICNLNDGYAINGWEAEPYENHSGIVDCFRNPKSDPKILAYYNQPLYVAIKTRNEIVASGTPATVDYYLINENDLKGAYTLKISALTPAGREAFTKEFPVQVAGGETYGQLLTEAVSIPTTTDAGLWNLRAQLVDTAGREVARGREQILVVDWKDTKLRGRGAIYEAGTSVQDFLKSQMGMTNVPAYTSDLGPLDWIFIARASYNEPATIPADALQLPDGSQAGLQATFFSGNNFTTQLSRRVDAKVDFNGTEGSSADAAVSASTPFCVRWEGRILPPRTGTYTFSATPTHGQARLKIDGKDAFKGTFNLSAHVPVSIVLDFVPGAGKSGIVLNWIVPAEKKEDPAALLNRARQDGTTIIIADHADSWMDLVKAATPVTYGGAFKIGDNWLGGQYFAVAHPLFKDLPANAALNWPYQTVIDRGRARYGLELEGEQLIAGCWQSWPMQLGTAVGIIPSGKGKIVVSTLDICSHLHDPPGPAEVARKLFINYISFAAPNSP